MDIPIPAGFQFAGIHCGIKNTSKNKDLALIVADSDAAGAGVYTQNLVCAAPVVLCRRCTPSDKIRAIVVNSGVANACTGEQGMIDAQRMAQLTADAIGATPEQILVMSTGVIGQHLPMSCLEEGIPAAAAALANSPEAFTDAATGILTTDQGTKVAGERFLAIAGDIRVAAMAKGAGMIGPNMATMLGVIVTDAALTPEDAQAALRAAVDESFNCISVEGHTSTNDSVALLASGAATAKPLTGPDLDIFKEVLKKVCIDAAKKIPADGEGATHLVEINVEGCATRDAARQIAKAVADSPLVKTAFTGNDPNWGRIVSAAGYADVPFDPNGVGLSINGFTLFEKGSPVPFDAAAVSASMKESFDVNVRLTFTEGRATTRFWTSDLSVEYVRFNSEYTT